MKKSCYPQKQKQRKCRKYVENVEMQNLKIMYFQVQIFVDNRRNYTIYIRCILKVWIQKFKNLL